MTFQLVKPNFAPPLDREFRPAVLANRRFQKEVAGLGQGRPLAIGLERADGCLSRFETQVFPDGHPHCGANLIYVENSPVVNPIAHPLWGVSLSTGIALRNTWGIFRIGFTYLDYDGEF